MPVTLRFPPVPAEEDYRLLELPSELLNQVETVPLTIKGKPSDDAVLCTPTSTYLIRTVGISNSLLVCRPQGADLEIRDISHEVIELVPQPPNLERTRALLSPTAWTGVAGQKRKREGRSWTRAQLESVIQASDAELAQGLKERNVVEVDGRLVLLPPVTLGPLLTIVFNLLAIHGKSALGDTSGVTRGPSRAIIRGLEEHDVPPELSSALMRLFSADAGRISDEGEFDVEWVADTRAMVREVGRGLLEGMKGQRRVDQFEEDWQRDVADWEGLVDIKLLEGNYLLHDPPPTALAHPSPFITYFPAHTLPLTPAIRFADLFLTRTPWRPEDMTPFLNGLYRKGDTKERDKLIAKFIRVVKEKSGVWWYPRRTS